MNPNACLPSYGVAGLFNGRLRVAVKRDVTTCYVKPLPQSGAVLLVGVRENLNLILRQTHLVSGFVVDNLVHDRSHENNATPRESVCTGKHALVV